MTHRAPADTTTGSSHSKKAHPPPEGSRRGRDEGGRQRKHANSAPRGVALDAPLPAPDHPPEIPEDRLDPDAIRVISRLRHAGHEAYFVGGCVRDAMLGRVPKDFDVATSAHPGEVRATFRNCRLIGRRFRLAHVYFRGGKVIEVATFRKNPIDALEDLGDDADLLITRDNVFGSAEEDARRRDFTVNGLFYDVFAGEVIDYVGGRTDLEAHRIATIGDPEIRLQEDPVRALRAVRFAARLGFAIEPETFTAMRRHAPGLSRCAPPRVLDEIFKILRCGAAARAFELLRTCGALGVVLPALGAFFERASDGERRRFLAHLSALDDLVKRGDDPSESVLLGALLLHLPAAEAGEPSERDDLLAELVATARLPRRIAERTRLALSAQRTFRAPLKRRKRGIAHQTYFTGALQLLEISVQATGEGVDLLEKWKTAEHGGRGRDTEGHRTARGTPAAHAHASHAPEHRSATTHQEGERGSKPDHRQKPKLVDVDEAGDEAGPESAPRLAEAEEGPSAGSLETDAHGRRKRRRRGGRRRRRRGGSASDRQTAP